MKIKEKQKVLGGRGTVLTYANGNAVGQYFYRELITGTKKYRQKLIEGATTLTEAVDRAMDTALAMREEQPHHKSEVFSEGKDEKDPQAIILREEKLLKRRERLINKVEKNGKKSIAISAAIEEYLKLQKKRVDAGTFALNSYNHKFHCFTKIHNYLQSKGLTRTNQINETTFDDYLIFRSDTTRILQSRELSVLGEWIKNYLVRYKYINSDLWLKGNFLPKVEVRMVDRMANPAINPEDWQEIIHFVRDVWRKAAYEPWVIAFQGDPNYAVRKPDKKKVYWRNMFWHYILFSKNTGMSPEEILKLKWKNVEIRDVGRISKTKLAQDIQEVEKEGYGEIRGTVDEWYEYSTEGNPNEWAASKQQLGREERLVAYITTIRSKTKQPREIPCNQGEELKRWLKFQKDFCTKHDIEHTFTGNDYVFSNPMNNFQPVNQNRVGSTWREIIKHLLKEGRLKGHKFSDKRYTLYSMRATFIEDHLLKGTDVFLLARIAGHDVKTLCNPMND